MFQTDALDSLPMICFPEFWHNGVDTCLGWTNYHQIAVASADGTIKFGTQISPPAIYTVLLC